MDELIDMIFKKYHKRIKHSCDIEKKAFSYMIENNFNLMNFFEKNYNYHSCKSNSLEESVTSKKS